MFPGTSLTYPTLSEAAAVHAVANNICWSSVSMSPHQSVASFYGDSASFSSTPAFSATKCHQTDGSLTPCLPSVDKSKTVVCVLCNATFASAGVLKVHTNCVHLKNYPYTCGVCRIKKGFTTKERFTDHMNMHNNIKVHQCPKCSRLFTFKANLRKHLRDRTCIK